MRSNTRTQTAISEPSNRRTLTKVNVGRKRWTNTYIRDRFGVSLGDSVTHDIRPASSERQLFTYVERASYYYRHPIYIRNL